MSTTEGFSEPLPAEIAAALEPLIDRFEEGWRLGRPPSIDELLLAAEIPPPGPSRRIVLRELVLTEIEYRAARGDSVSLEAYFERYPELAGDGKLLAESLRSAASGEAERVTPQATPRAGAATRSDADDHRPGEPPATAEDGPAETVAGIRRLGKFELLEVLGRGSFGEVYRARDLRLGREIALKIPRAEWLDAQDAERFLREARHAARLRHPGIVRVYEAGSIGATHYLACELVAGGTLRARLKQGPLGYRESAEIVAQLADALAHAHGKGVVHRDVKPSNVLFDADCQPLLADFGLAKRDGFDPTLTLTGAALGTPAFMAPEQLKGQIVDARSDIYSLGVVLYEMLTGQLPFLGRGRMLVLQLLEDDPRPPRRLDDQIPLDLESICLKAMRSEAQRRYQTADEFAADLRRYLRGEPVQARPAGRISRAIRWCRRRPALTGLAAALLLALVGGFAGITWQWRRAESHLAELQRERERAERNFQQAHQTLADITRLSSNGDFEGLADDRPLRKELAELALAHYQRFLEHEGKDPSLTAEAIDAHTLIAKIYESSGGARLKAVESHRAALRLIDRACRGRSVADAAPYFRKKAAIHYTVAHLFSDEGKFAEAEAEIAISRQITSELLLLDPDSSQYRYEEIRALIALTQARLGAERRDAAAVDAQQVQTLLAPLASRRHDAPGFLVALAECYTDLGSTWLRLGRLDEAAAAHRRCGELLEQALQQDASSVSDLTLAQNEYLLGSIEWDRRRPGDSLACHLRGCRRLEAMLERQPHARACLALLASHVQCLARCWRETGHPEEAIASFRRAVEIWERLIPEFPGIQPFQAAHGAALHSLGNLYRDQQEPEPAVEFYRQAIPIRQKLCEHNPSLASFPSDLSGTLYNLAEVFEQLGRLPEAFESYRQAAEHERKVVALQPQEEKWRRRLRDRQRALDRVQTAIDRQGVASGAPSDAR
ncbi:MAG TPA: serine/threonine-protein kinase [Pirellulales bacterium]|nr:serine/threonine-protein kinase [Pirellulales bacterium]